MATDRDMSSVLAKLMGIDKPLRSRTTHRRHRVLSENYLQNIASVAKREKAFLYVDDAECNMDDSEDEVDFLGGGSLIEHQIVLCRTETSSLAGRSFSTSSYSSADQKRKKYVSEENSGMLSHGRRRNSVYDSIRSPIQGSLSSQVAKQITGQVKHSVWHNCAELSRSKPRSEKSYENEAAARMTSSACLFDFQKKNEASPFNPVRGYTCREPQKGSKQLLERWRTRKSPQEIGTSCGSKNQDELLVTCSNGRNFVLHTSDMNFSTPFRTANVNGCPVLAARYLSKPARFPSAWVPRSRVRHFTFDKSWCLRPAKRDHKQCDDSEEDEFGHKDLRSTSECSSLQLKKLCGHQAASLFLDESVELAEQKSYEETFSVAESLSNRSGCLGVENPAYHEAHITVNETEKDVSRDSTVDSSPLKNNIALCSGIGEHTDEENKKLNMLTNLRREDLSAKSTTCILLGDGESWKHQLENKKNASEPRSPVSSLEGPESSGHVPLTVEVAEHLSVSLENGAHGMQRKLQLMETMSLESGSEGPEMMVSSEEGDDGASIGLYQNDPQLMEIYQTLIKESWDYSYVVDVVVESGLQMRDLEMESQTWCLRGYVLEPLVFDMLEKKYGKNMPWEKLERRLLFDRINSGLLEIVKPSVGLNTWRKPVAKRLCPRQKSQELIEEELWSLLVNEQEEFKRDSSDKVCRKEMEWLDLEEDTELIVQEIQSLLIVELIEEFVCMEISLS